MFALVALAAFAFTPVTVPGGAIFNFFAPNDKGQIPLYTSVGSGIWQNGNFTLLPPPPQGIAAVTPTGINNEGVVVGIAYTADSHEMGFLLVDSNYTLFSRPSWDNTEPRFVAASGLVTGDNFSDVGNLSAGFVYDPATGQFTDATPAGSDLTVVQGMNRLGVISGSGHDPDLGDYSFTWQQSTSAKGHGAAYFNRFTVDNKPSKVRGINDAGVIVGYTADGAEGFVGNSAMGFRLVHLPGAGNALTVCEGINNLSQVTCAYYGSNSHEHVFIITPTP
jgi:hypothetical protein